MSADEPTTRRATETLADPVLRRFLEDFVRRRVSSSDVDDVVQTVLCEALAAPNRPSDAAELRRWLIGIARHKIVDVHRKTARERPDEIPDGEAAPPPVEAHSLAHWAEKQVGSSRDAKQTLAWMAREGEGDKLENIAADENVPAARVRQRVSRMRRWMKERWLAEVALVAALGVIAFVVYELLRKPHETPIAVPEPTPSATAPEPVEPSPMERARALRADAFERCDRAEWQGCLDELDQARFLDPVGDDAPEVTSARSRAADALRSQEHQPVPPDPTSKAAPVTTPSAAPMPKKAAPQTKPTESLDDRKKLEQKQVEQKMKSDAKKARAKAATTSDVTFGTGNAGNLGTGSKGDEKK